MKEITILKPGSIVAIKSNPNLNATITSVSIYTDGSILYDCSWWIDGRIADAKFTPADIDEPYEANYTKIRMQEPTE